MCAITQIRQYNSRYQIKAIKKALVWTTLVYWPPKHPLANKHTHFAILSFITKLGRQKDWGKSLGNKYLNPGKNYQWKRQKQSVKRVTDIGYIAANWSLPQRMIGKSINQATSQVPFTCSHTVYIYLRCKCNTWWLNSVQCTIQQGGSWRVVP